MASFHCAVKSGVGGRGGSHSQYIEREGKYKTADKDDLEHAETLNLPEWAMNSAEFWKQSDLLERANSSGYREYEIALPREMSPDQRLAFVREFIATEIGEKHVCTFAIHCPSAALEGGEQPHAHIMFSERTHDGIKRATPEHYFKRASTKEPERGGCKKANGVPKTPADRKADLVALRERFAALQNKHLEKHGHADRVTHLSLEAQGIEREPEIHVGPKRIQAKTPEVAQVMAARADRALSDLLERSIAVGERRMARWVKVRKGREEQSKAAVSAFQAKTTQSPQPRPAASPEPVVTPVSGINPHSRYHPNNIARHAAEEKAAHRERDLIAAARARERERLRPLPSPVPAPVATVQPAREVVSPALGPSLADRLRASFAKFVEWISGNGWTHIEIDLQRSDHYGSVIRIDDLHAVQRTGRGQVAIHQLDRLDKLPGLDDPKMEIKYRDGAGHIFGKLGQALER